jgi:hypothetical protein
MYFFAAFAIRRSRLSTIFRKPFSTPASTGGAILDVKEVSATKATKATTQAILSLLVFTVTPLFS